MSFLSVLVFRIIPAMDMDHVEDQIYNKIFKTHQEKMIYNTRATRIKLSHILHFEGSKPVGGVFVKTKKKIAIKRPSWLRKPSKIKKESDLLWRTRRGSPPLVKDTMDRLLNENEEEARPPLFISAPYS